MSCIRPFARPSQVNSLILLSSVRSRTTYLSTIPSHQLIIPSLYISGPSSRFLCARYFLSSPLEPTSSTSTSSDLILLIPLIFVLPFTHDHHAFSNMDCFRAVRRCSRRPNPHILRWIGRKARHEDSDKLLSNVGREDPGWEEYGHRTCVQSQQCEDASRL